MQQPGVITGGCGTGACRGAVRPSVFAGPRRHSRLTVPVPVIGKPLVDSRVDVARMLGEPRRVSVPVPWMPDMRFRGFE